MNAEERQLQALIPEDLSVVSSNGTYWLCRFDEKARTITSGLRDDASMQEWFLHWNVESLQEIKLSRQSAYTVRKLRPEEIEEFERVKVKLLRAKRYAMNYWENEVYKKHIP